jgi:hypothetical protein
MPAWMRVMLVGAGFDLERVRLAGEAARGK